MAFRFYFNLEEAPIFEALSWENAPGFKFAPILKKVFLIFFLLFFFIFLFGFFSQRIDFFPVKLDQKLNQKLLGSSIIFLSFGVLFWTQEAFFCYLKDPKVKVELKKVIANPEKYNLAEFLDFESAKTVFFAEKFAKTKRIPLNSSVLFYSLLTLNPKVNFIFYRCLLDLRIIKKKLEDYFKICKKNTKEESFETFENSILEALKIAEEKGHKKIEIGDLFLSLAKHDLVFKKILIEADLKIEDMESLTWWLESLEKEEEKRKKWWEWENLAKIGSIGKDFAAGYTITLDKYSIDLTKEVMKMGYPEIIGHQKEIEAMERILARKEACNDPLIVGEAGSGRRSMILALAKKSIFGESLPEVNYKRIVQLNLPALLAQLESLEVVESTLERIFREVILAGNVILVIDELHNFVGGGKMARAGTIDISGILTPYISSPHFQVIGITTYEGLHRNIEQNPSLLSFFEKIEVSEISRQETLKLLERLALKLEQRYQKLISFPALRDIIKYCERYITATPFPEKALDLLEEIMVHLAQSREKILLPKHVAKIVSEKIQVPVGEVEKTEKEVLLNLENLLHQRVVDQDEALKEVSAALRRARTQVTIRRGPIGCFLFLGPTGVGKTETAKALAEFYFGSENRMIRLDMSEFQNVEDIPRLIGSPGEEGLLTTPVRENPFSLILLDEFEKAHPNILNLFLQVFDEGHLTDGLGRKVDFKNTIIIATSNAGYQMIFKAAKENKDWTTTREQLINFLVENGIFRPELLNRFDAVVLYKPLTKENLLSIAELLLKKIQKQLKEKQIDFIIEDPLKEKIVELAYRPEFGARQMQRVIQDKIGNALAEAILREEIKRGDRIGIDHETFRVVKKGSF